MRLKLASALGAALAAASPSPAPAQAEPGKNDLHPALIAEAGIGDVVVYLSDDFRRSAPVAAEPLHMITIRRSNPGDALNSPADDMNGLHRYMKANSGFAAKDLVALASSRDLIRVYFRGQYPALAEGFKYPGATLSEAGPEIWPRLRSIAIADFARFMAKNATRQAEGERWVLGPKVPRAEGRALIFTLGIEAASAEQSRILAAGLRGKNYDGVSHNATLGGPKAVEFQAWLRFSEASFQRLMNGVCADAAKSGAECVAWSAKFTPIKLKP